MDSFSKKLVEDRCQSTVRRKVILYLIPHGTLIAQMNSEQIESIKTPVFGNKHGFLRWESDREIKEKLMKAANLPMYQSLVTRTKT